MHVGMPARSVLPTVDAPVLLALHGSTRALTGRRLAVLAGASHTAVNAILSRLASAGVVFAEQQGSAVLYRENRDHVAWPAIEALAGMRSAALAAMTAEVTSWDVVPVTALCFGSFARGDGDEHSDIDVLLLRPPGVDELDRDWDRQQAALRDLVRLKTGNTCQVLAIGLERLLAHVDLDDALVRNWLHDGILLAGSSLSSTIAAARERTGTPARAHEVTAGPHPAHRPTPEHDCARRSRS